jgi:hypothetical protein
MRNQQLLKSSIEAIKTLRLEIHDDIGGIKRDELDQIIKNLECYEGQQITANQILEVLGKAISYLPALEKIIDFLSGL